MSLADLGRRAAACRHWQWLGGMVLVHPASNDGSTGWAHRLAQGGAVASFRDYPDLSDEATRLLILPLVRVAWSNPLAMLQYDHNFQHWSCGYSPDNSSWVNYGAGDTEGEALIAALEAAP